jgi:CO/xanthine dehydrogenase FAD-binding subunit
VGAVQIQNRGTVGGNIVNASPAGDSLPLWLVLDAVMVVASVAGERRIPADSFFLGYRKVDLKADELLVAVEVPAVQSKVIYRKTGTRLAQAISKVILGARIAPGEFRVALGAVAPVPLRLKALEDALVAGERDRGVLKTLVESGIAPITDIRSTEAYRRRVAVNLVMRALE